jgi:hypothetical protein
MSNSESTVFSFLLNLNSIFMRSRLLVLHACLFVLLFLRPILHLSDPTAPRAVDLVNPSIQAHLPRSALFIARTNAQDRFIGNVGDSPGSGDITASPFAITRWVAHAELLRHARTTCRSRRLTTLLGNPSTRFPDVGEVVVPCVGGA